MENVVNIAKINNNLRPMYVKEIIFEHTDEAHYITVGEILEMLEKQVNNLTEENIQLRKTIDIQNEKIDSLQKQIIELVKRKK